MEGPVSAAPASSLFHHFRHTVFTAHHVIHGIAAHFFLDRWFVVIPVEHLHVIQLIEKHPPEQAPFDEMENSIQKFLFMEEAKKQVEVYIEGLRKQATIETFF